LNKTGAVMDVQQAGMTLPPLLVKHETGGLFSAAE
jgi:hypothetical protein